MPIQKSNPSVAAYAREHGLNWHTANRQMNDTPDGEYEKGLVINDLHIPFEDLSAIELALSVGEDFDPDIIFLNGDVLDCYLVNRFVKNQKTSAGATLAIEVSRGRDFLQMVRSRFPKPKRIVYLFGNHEYRWLVFIATRAPELYGLRGLTLEDQLGLDDLGIECINRGTKENSFLWGSLLIGHFDRVNKHSGYTAKALIEDKAISLIQAHTHRGGSSYRRLYDRDIAGYENFCLCSRNPEYVDRPNWQLGFSTVVNNGKKFHVTQHPILEDGGVYTTWFQGTEFVQEDK